MQALSRRPVAQPIEYRRFRPEESGVLLRYFLRAGYPVPLSPQDTGWGAWNGEELVGALALSREHGEWLVRGPEIDSAYRRRRVGSALISLAIPEIRSLRCYCIAYTFLVRMYSRAGFRACPRESQPAFLARRVAKLRESQWDVVLLTRAPD